MRILPIAIDEKALGGFCHKHGVAELSLFGSVLREDFRSDSDVDVLVRFAEGVTLTLESYVEMREELSAMMEGREIDLVEEGRLGDPYRRFEIMRTREKVYGD